MIYVKNDNKVITKRILVPKDEFYGAKSDNYVLKEFIKNSDFGKQYVTNSTYEELKNRTLRADFNSYSLINNLICSEDMLTDFEAIFESDLPIEVKIKYLKKINGYFDFIKFCKDVYPLFKLETIASYEIEKLRTALGICSDAGVYTEASDIITSENIEIAENNSKVLKLVKKVSKVGELEKSIN